MACSGDRLWGEESTLIHVHTCRWERESISQMAHFIHIRRQTEECTHLRNIHMYHYSTGLTGIELYFMFAELTVTAQKETSYYRP